MISPHSRARRERREREKKFNRELSTNYRATVPRGTIECRIHPVLVYGRVFVARCCHSAATGKSKLRQARPAFAVPLIIVGAGPKRWAQVECGMQNLSRTAKAIFASLSSQ